MQGLWVLPGVPPGVGVSVAQHLRRVSPATGGTLFGGGASGTAASAPGPPSHAGAGGAPPSVTPKTVKCGGRSPPNLTWALSHGDRSLWITERCPSRVRGVSGHCVGGCLCLFRMCVMPKATECRPGRSTPGRYERRGGGGLEHRSLCTKNGTNQYFLFVNFMISHQEIWRRAGGGQGWDASEGPQRRPQRRLDRRLEEFAKAVGGGYCRLQMPLRLELGVRETVVGRPGGRGGGPPLPMRPWGRGSKGGGGAPSTVVSRSTPFLPLLHSCRWGQGGGAGAGSSTPQDPRPEVNPKAFRHKSNSACAPLPMGSGPAMDRPRHMQCGEGCHPQRRSLRSVSRGPSEEPPFGGQSSPRPTGESTSPGPSHTRGP